MNEHKKIYETEKWQRVRQIVIQRDKGICQMCHKLVYKKWTIHHKIELTDKNYLDENIAFGLDNLILVCSKCHNKIHDRFAKEKQTIVNDDLSIDYSKRKETR